MHVLTRFQRGWLARVLLFVSFLFTAMKAHVLRSRRVVGVRGDAQAQARLDAGGHAFRSEVADAEARRLLADANASNSPELG